MSSPYGHDSINSSFASNSQGHDEDILAIPPTTYTSRSHRPHHSVGSLRALPTLNNLPTSFAGGQIDLTEKGNFRGLLADWFQGESKPLSLSILPSSKEMDPTETISLSPYSNSVLDTVRTPRVLSKPPIASRFSFFSSKSSIQKPTYSVADPNDALLNLDVTKVLFPNGPLDSSSPAAYKDLVQKAEDLVAGLQTALGERTMSLNEMRAEKEAQSELLDDLEIRAKHLKIQLDGMTAKLAEQDDAMMNLVDELAHEKQLRHEEEYARKQSVKLIKTSRAEVAALGDKRTHERLGLQEQSRSSVVSDSGFESEDEYSLYSVSSKQQGKDSPIVSIYPYPTTISPHSLRSTPYSTTSSDDFFQSRYTSENCQTPNSRPKPPPQKLTTFQNCFKGLSGESRNDEPVASTTEAQVSSSSTSPAVQASEAWNIVEMLQEENQALKLKLDHMEGALNDCLEEIVSKIGN